MATIDGNELILFIVKAMPRQHLVRVRDRDPFEREIIKARLCRVRQILFAKQPIVIERIDAA